MKIIGRIFLLLFVIATLGNLMSYLVAGLDWNYYTKPVLLPSLMMYFIAKSTEKRAVFIATLVALFFSWAGDVLLMYQEQDQLYFLLGLSAFLLAHITYIFVYRKARWEEARNGLLPTQRMRYVFILVLAGCGLLYVLFPKLGPMRLPVTLYAIVLVAMTIVALLRFGYTTLKSFGLVFFGAILFMISDSLLAVNKFLEPLPVAGFWIMATYIGAQLCIVEGVATHKKRMPNE